MTISLLFSALAMQVLGSPDTVRWESTGSDSAGETAVDPRSITRTGDVVRVNVRTRIHRSASTGRPIVGIMRYAYDCRANTARMEVTDVYQADGRFVGTSRNDQPAEVIP